MFTLNTLWCTTTTHNIPNIDLWKITYFCLTFDVEPTRKYFPLAHHQAVWNDLIINGTDIAVVYVLQAHSLSYAWFPYATAKIEWDEDLESVSLGNMDRAPADTGKYMTSTSSCSSFWVSKITSYNYYTLSSLTLLFMLFLVL